MTKTVVLCLKVKISEIEKKRRELREKGLINRDYAISKDGTYAYIPLIKMIKGLRSEKSKNLVEKFLKKNDPVYDYKKELERILDKREQTFAPHSFDIIGTICILRIDDALARKRKKVAQVFIKIPGIQSVYVREGEYEGELRTQKLRWLAGRKSKETMHHESGARLKLDVEKTYFSTRLATERLRIAQQIKKKERVLVMFSGCSPYECVIAKNSPAQEIVGVELNKIAHRYACENVVLNKLEKKVTLYCGDVRKLGQQLKRKYGSFDRIIMPLPHDAIKFLDIAAALSRHGTNIHLYQFDMWEDVAHLKKKYAEIMKQHIPAQHISKIKIKDIVKCGHYSPSKFRICVDCVVQ